MRYARLLRRLAALAFFSTTPLASFLGSLPLLSQEGKNLGDTACTSIIESGLIPHTGISPFIRLAATYTVSGFAFLMAPSHNGESKFL